MGILPGGGCILKTLTRKKEEDKIDSQIINILIHWGSIRLRTFNFIFIFTVRFQFLLASELLDDNSFFYVNIRKKLLREKGGRAAQAPALFLYPNPRLPAPPLGACSNCIYTQTSVACAVKLVCYQQIDTV